MRARDWPALAETRAFPARLIWQHAIHGKPQGFARDFGFVASSAGFQGDRKEIESRFRISDQRTGRFALWWPSRGRYYASWCYPSRSPDEAGRVGLETQILEWEPVMGVPPALAAIATLSRITSLTSSQWPQRSRDPNFATAGFEVPLEPVYQEITEAECEALVATGLNQLNQLLTPSGLSDLYAALLSQRVDSNPQPAFLGGCVAPLDPVALASLLLPLSSSDAKTCSLAGWQVENRDWSVVVAPSAQQNRILELPKQQVDLPILMAESIRTYTPSLARGPQGEVIKILQFARDPVHRIPDENALSEAEQFFSDAEQLLITEAADRILREAQNIPEYLQKADLQVQQAFASQMRLKMDYVIAWMLRLKAPEDFTPLQDYLTSPGNHIADILHYWQRQKYHAGIARTLERLGQATPSMRSSSA